MKLAIRTIIIVALACITVCTIGCHASQEAIEISSQEAIEISSQQTSETSSQMEPNETTETTAISSQMEPNESTETTADYENVLYVSAHATIGGNGTSNKPFASIQEALDKARPGDTVLVEAGTYVGAIQFRQSGEKDSPITLKAEADADVLITLRTDEDGAIIDLNGCSDIVIENLGIGEAKATWNQGILISAGCTNVTVRNCDIYEISTNSPDHADSGGANAILCYGDGNTKDLTISDILIENNRVHDNVTGWCENISVAGNCERVTIRNNEVYNGTNIGIDLYGNAGYCDDPMLDQPRDCEVSSNIVHDCICPYAECAGIYVDGARDSVISCNTVFDNMYGIEIGSEERRDDYPVSNIEVKGNIVYHNPAGGIRIGGYDEENAGMVEDCLIADNLLTDNGFGDGGWNGEINFEKCRRITVKNNSITKSNSDYPMIGQELAKEYVEEVSFLENQYFAPNPDEMIFEFGGKSVVGIEAWKQLSGATDTAAKKTLKIRLAKIETLCYNTPL